MKFNKILALSCLLISGANSSTDYIQSPGFDESELNIPCPDFSGMEHKLIHVETVYPNIRNFNEDDTPNPNGICPYMYMHYQNTDGSITISETLGTPNVYNRLPESYEDSVVFFTIAGVDELFQN